ncbi:hypothetical protein SLOPH_225 [Spraguea lophii 42_110]|uniref:ISXO2-like transposase domain-containing protein n=1 Tax=Spraguea lophii (strain 42_110) TaxID=1358809 RepID=S7XFM2_SPRLO|nr:hypothetical protein SLOPH_225 [Spraguea lophii 42_110]
MKINNNKIGGYNKWVEVDESAVARRKYNVGRLVRTIWVVGGIERGSNNMFFRVTKSRNSDFLRNTIKNTSNPNQSLSLIVGEDTKILNHSTYSILKLIIRKIL